MPMMPTRSVGLAYIASGEKTVMPPHRSGPASAKLSFSGSWMVQAERPGVGEAQLLRQLDGPSPVRADVGREPAAMTDYGCLRLRAKVMASRHTLMTIHAATRVPADPDALSDLDSFG